MKVVVIGSNGQLGSDVCSAFQTTQDWVVPLTHADVEIESLESVHQAVDMHHPQIVVNTAAMHHVDLCEQDPEQAFKINALGARNLALASNSVGAVLFHISTDYVFDGSKGTPYVEQDEATPVNAYGISKLAAEHFVRSIAKRHFVLRVSGLYGTSPCRAKGGLNFVELMLKLAREREELRVVDSEVLTPTPTADVAQQIVALKEVRNYGLYHATAEGACSWFEFASEIFRLADIKVKLGIASASEFPAKTPRPKYSVLENAKLKELGLNMFQPWQLGLKNYLANHDVSADAFVAVADR